MANKDQRSTLKVHVVDETLANGAHGSNHGYEYVECPVTQGWCYSGGANPSASRAKWGCVGRQRCEDQRAV